MRIEYRFMEEADLGQVAELEKICFSNPWSLEAFRDSLSKDYYCYMVAVTEQNQVVAQAGLIISLDEADITNVATNPEYRGRGISTRLLRNLMQAGEQKGIRAFTLEVREHNEPALHLYRKLGFQEDGIRKNFYTNPTENAIIMWKNMKHSGTD